MNLEIEIISTEVVIPSSPTPHHLKDYKLSFIDQTIPHFLIPHVLFYPPNNDNNPNHNLIISNSERSKHLKRSLSQALTLFYPLAGRLVGNNYVNCNDEGVTYIEAQANFKIFDVINDPIVEGIDKFNPSYPNPFVATDVCMVIQATFFCCGGLAIGLRISHKIADAISYFMFVNGWAAASRGDVPQSPIFEVSTLLQPRSDLVLVPVVKKESAVIIKKRLVFTAQKIADLRDKYTSNDIRPTRVEALSTFIWTRFMVATGAKDDASKVYVLRFPVDIRTKMVPSLSEYHFGNIFLPAITAGPSLGDDEEDAAGYGIVKKIRDAIRIIDGDYIAKMIHEGNKPVAKKELSEGKEIVMFRFSSLCRIPLYKADFGWGKPILVGSGNTPISNVVHFMATFDGEGIEAWVNLKEKDMTKFEGDEELLDYVSSV